MYISTGSHVNPVMFSPLLSECFSMVPQLFSHSMIQCVKVWHRGCNILNNFICLLCAHTSAVNLQTDYYGLQVFQRFAQKPNVSHRLIKCYEKHRFCRNEHFLWCSWEIINPEFIKRKLILFKIILLENALNLLAHFDRAGLQFLRCLRKRRKKTGDLEEKRKPLANHKWFSSFVYFLVFLFFFPFFFKLCLDLY